MVDAVCIRFGFDLSDLFSVDIVPPPEGSDQFRQKFLRHLTPDNTRQGSWHMISLPGTLLEVADHLYQNHAIFLVVASPVLTSDDRIKFNEKSLTNGLEVIRQLLPQEYMKSKEIDVEVDLEKEIGLIAQEVRQIPQLEHVVFQEPENPDGKLSVNYTQIFVYAIQAIKELDRKVAMLEARLAG